MRIVITSLAIGLLFQLQAQQGFLPDFKQKWLHAMEYTLEFAELMPADQYDFSPTQSQMPFHRQLTHIAGNMIWITSAYLGGTGFEDDPKEPPTSKKKVIKHLQKAFDYATGVIEAFDEDDLDASVDFFAGAMSKRRMFFLLDDHVAHHRGQMVVYLRLNDIEPPRYRGW